MGGGVREYNGWVQEGAMGGRERAQEGTTGVCGGWAKVGTRHEPARCGGGHGKWPSGRQWWWAVQWWCGVERRRADLCKFLSLTCSHVPVELVTYCSRVV